MCVVIGGGNVAHRKILSLMRAKAEVKLVSPAATDELKKLARNGSIAWIKRGYARGDLKGAALAFVATDSSDARSEAVNEAIERGIPVNVADEPEQCTFTLPSIAERGDLMIAVSTGAKCPSLARQVRLEIEDLIDDAYGEMLALLARVREELLSAGIDHDKCRDLLNNLITSDILSLLREGKKEKASKLAREGMAELLAGKAQRLFR